MARFDVETTGSTIVKTFAQQVKGKTFLITGPSSKGLGAETALALASAAPKRILLAGRSLPKIQPVIDEIKGTDSSIDVQFIPLDLSSNSSVRDAASKINELVDRLDVVFNVAGVMGLPEYTRSVDGNEMQFASNHLGHFLLTNLLMEKIAKAKGVVVNVSSTGYELNEVQFEDPNFSVSSPVLALGFQISFHPFRQAGQEENEIAEPVEQGGKTYNPWKAYAQSKTANILFSVALAERGLTAFSCDPGLVVESNLQANGGVTMELFGEGLQMSIERNDGVDVYSTMVPVTLQQGAATILLAGLDPSLREKSGVFLKECAAKKTREYASDKGNAEKLWALSEKLLGQKFEV